MRAVWFKKSGPAREVLQYGEMPTPIPKPGEVLVHLKTSAVNPSDVKKRSGLQPAGFVDGYVIPHSDGAGIIEAVGDGLDKTMIGERVWVYQAQYQRHQGTCAEYVCLPVSMTGKLPEDVGFEIGACIGIPIMTAHRCVFNVDSLCGKNVLVTGASGRVGFYATQWAKLAGANVIATAGNEDRCQVAKISGADHVLSYQQDDLAGSLMQITQGCGFDHIVDVEFGMNAELDATVLRNNGTISTYSSSLNPCPTIPFYTLMFKNISLNMVLVYNIPYQAKQQAINDIERVLTHDQFKHRIAQSWSLEKTAKAHQAIEQGGINGCAIINID